MPNKIRLKKGQRTANIMNALHANSDEWLSASQISALVKVKDASGQLFHMHNNQMVERKIDSTSGQKRFVYRFKSFEPTFTKKTKKRMRPRKNVRAVVPSKGNGAISRSDILLGGVDEVLFKAATDHAEYKNTLKKIRDMLNNLEGLD
jgi:hypothetical protein